VLAPPSSTPTLQAEKQEAQGSRAASPQGPVLSGQGSRGPGAAQGTSRAARPGGAGPLYWPGVVCVQGGTTLVVMTERPKIEMEQLARCAARESAGGGGGGAGGTAAAASVWLPQRQPACLVCCGASSCIPHVPVEPPWTQDHPPHHPGAHAAGVPCPTTAATPAGLCSARGPRWCPLTWRLWPPRKRRRWSSARTTPGQRTKRMPRRSGKPLPLPPPPSTHSVHPAHLAHPATVPCASRTPPIHTAHPRTPPSWLSQVCHPAG